MTNGIEKKIYSHREGWIIRVSSLCQKYSDKYWVLGFIAMPLEATLPHNEDHVFLQTNRPVD